MIILNKKFILGILVIVAVLPLFDLTANPVANTSPNSSAPMDLLISKDGIWNPSTYYNRYRKDEFSEPFTQWYYYKADNFATHESFATCYFMYWDVSSNLQGIMMLFSYISPSGNIEVAYKLPIEQVNYIGNYVNFDWGNEGKFSQRATSDSQYVITGLFDNPSLIWNSYITHPSYSESDLFSWSLTFDRIIGCFSQNDDALSSSGVLWNSDAFDTTVSGQIQMGSNLINVGGSNWRGYHDMNWGTSFITPSDDPEDPAKYRWGWIHVTSPSAIPSNDFSLITAFADQGDFLGLPLENQAVFASVYNALPERQTINWKTAYADILGLKTVIFEECSYGTSLDCFIDTSYTADDFFTYTDNFGDAQVPHHQNVVLEGEFVKIITDIYVDAEDITRLLTPSPQGIYSNFEGLGADAHVKVYRKTYKWWDIGHAFPQYSLIKDIQNNNAGVEFGYKLPINFP